MKLPNIASLTVLGLVFWAVETYIPNAQLGHWIDIAVVAVTAIAKAWQERQAAKYPVASTRDVGRQPSLASRIFLG